MNYQGIIIKESLEDLDVLDLVNIPNTRVSSVKERDKTPWIKQWTMHKVEIAEDKAGEIAEKISRSLDPKHNWYADYKNDAIHYVIFRNKVFKIDRTKKEEYEAAKEYGLSLGIPDYQLSFGNNLIKK